MRLLVLHLQVRAGLQYRLAIANDWSGFEEGDISNISSLQLQNILKALPATYQACMGHERVWITDAVAVGGKGLSLSLTKEPTAVNAIGTARTSRTLCRGTWKS